MKKRHILAVKGCEFQMKMKSVKAVLIFLLLLADCQAVVEIKNDLIRTMGECRDVTDQYQTGRSDIKFLLIDSH